MSSINPDVVNVLVELDPASIGDAMDHGDLALLRYVSGNPITPGDAVLVGKAGRAELAAADSMRRHEIEIAEQRLDVVRRSRELLSKYGMSTNEVIGDVLPRMTPEDRAIMVDAAEQMGIDTLKGRS